MPISSQALYDAIKDNDIHCINGRSQNTLYEFEAGYYCNAILLAARFSNLATLQAIHNKLSSHQKRKLYEEDVDGKGRTVLMLVVEFGSHSEVKYILQTMSNLHINQINDRDTQDERYTALEYCLLNYNENILDELIISGAKFYPSTWNLIYREKLFDYFTEARFMYCVEQNYRHYVQVFCDYFTECYERRINIARFFSYKNAERRNALMVCARKHFNDLFKLLLKQPFQLQDRDDSHHTLFYYLLQNGEYGLIEAATRKLQRFTQHTVTDFSSKLNYLSQGTESDRKRVGGFLTTDAKYSRDGMAPLAHPDKIPRPYRSFTSERTRQILRHTSTQLFFYIQKKHNGLEEVESMYLKYNGRNYLFIVGNPIKEFSKERQSLIPHGQLQRVITTAYAYRNRNALEKNARSARYAAKLAHRIYGGGLIPNDGSAVDKAKAEAIKTILCSGRVESLELNNIDDDDFYDFLDDPTYQNAIIVLYFTGNPPENKKSRHAEEFLVDILDNLPNKPTYSCIAGKKRPCLGCYGRMQDQVSEFGENPGLYWEHSMKYQPEQVAKRTISALLTKPAHVSITANGQETTLFDSGSDSDA